MSGATYVLLDESGNGNLDQPLIVGALVTTKLDSIEQQMRDHYENASADHEMLGLPSFSKFVKDGFHYSSDPFEIQIAFINFISRLHGYRLFIAKTDRSRLSDITDDDRILILYVALLADVISNARTREIVFLFETNEALNPKFERAVEIASERSRAQSTGRATPTVRVEIVRKKDPLSMGIIDYCMAALSLWFKEGCPTDATKLPARLYRRFERNIAVIFDFDANMRSSRSNRAFH